MSIGIAAAKRSRAASIGATTSAKRRQCPACGRKAALSAKVEHPDGWARGCQYCGHAVGVTNGVYFGFDASGEQHQP